MIGKDLEWNEMRNFNETKAELVLTWIFELPVKDRVWKGLGRYQTKFFDVADWNIGSGKDLEYNYSKNPGLSWHETLPMEFMCRTLSTNPLHH